MITVVAALIEKDNKILIAKRSTGDSSVFGKWEFPGGKVEVNESEFDAIEREMKEEFDVSVKANKFLINSVCTYPTKTVDLRLYSCTYISGEFKIHDDHSDYKWISVNDINKYDFCKADVKLAEYVKQVLGKF